MHRMPRQVAHIMSELRFEEEGHRYFYDGRELPSVTRILKALNLIEEQHYANDYLKIFGQAVHTVCAMWSRGEHAKVERLLARQENEPLRPRLAAWQDWCERFGFVAEHVELRICDPVCWYAGTLDILGRWDKDTRMVLPDLKTGKVEWWVTLQTAAYEQAARSCGYIADPRPCVRIGLELRDNGRAYPTNYDLANNDLRLWISAMALYNTKASHNGGKLP